MTMKKQPFKDASLLDKNGVFFQPAMFVSEIYPQQPHQSAPVYSMASAKRVSPANDIHGDPCIFWSFIWVITPIYNDMGAHLGSQALALGMGFRNN